MKLRLTKDGFNAFADTSRDTADVHDRVHDAYQGKLGDKFKEKTRKRVDWIVSNSKSKKILDVGCSQGTVPILLGRKGMDVLGVDIDVHTVKEANKILEKEPKAVRDLVRFENKDFLEYDSGGEKFDTIIFSELLEHLVNPEVFIEKAHSLSADGGRLVVTVPFGINDHPDHRQVYYPGEMYFMLSEYFDVKDVKVIGKWIGIVAEKNIRREAVDSINKDLIVNEEQNFYEIERNLEEKLKTLKQKNKDMYQLNYQKRQEFNEVSRELRKTKNSLISIKNSRSYRASRLFIDVIKRPRRLIKLPIRLISLVIKKPLISSLYVDDVLGIRTVNIRNNIPRHKLNNPSAVTNKKLRVASILDDFSYGSFSPECEMLQLSTQYWKVEMDEYKPDMLFVESAWRGKEGDWEHLVSNFSKDLDLVIKYCQERNIPTVFWCKEDPVHFDKFINTAKYFDYIFTSDIHSVDKYRDIVGHDRVRVLRFAAQPKLMNPIEKYDRKDAVCFAGTYYVKYKERVREFGEIVDELIKNNYDIEIYDRNYNRGDANYFYPDKYQEYIKGTLSFDEIDKAYKGYKYALTMNTIQNSKTMFARRAYELLASNTITISNYCLGIKTQLGDLVISSKKGKDIVEKFKKVTYDETYSRKFKLMGLREVLDHHTYDIRLEEISSIVFDNYMPVEQKPKVSVIAKTTNQEELDHIITMFDDQSYSSKNLYVITPKNLKVPKKVVTIKSSESISKIKSLGSYISLMDPNDYYGRNFLLDLMLATKFSDKPVIGKSAYYAAVENQVTLKNDTSQYSEASEVLTSSRIVKSSSVKNKKVIDLDQTAEEFETLSIDEFSYCRGGANLDKKQIEVIEGIIEGIDTGVGR